MFIGEAPGFNEDQAGTSFVGAAGQFLEELLASINLTRRQVYIANVIKCRPPNNRDPCQLKYPIVNPGLNVKFSCFPQESLLLLAVYSMAKYFPGKSISKYTALSRL